MTATLNPPERPSPPRDRPTHDDSRGLARSLAWFSIGLGLAEIVAPGGIARVVGVRDSAANRNTLRALGVATAGIAAVTLIHALAGRTLSRQNGHPPIPKPRSKDVHVVRAITVGRPAEEVHRFWRALDNLPRFMSHLESVIVLDDRRSHWKARAPAGASVEWDAEIVEDRPDLLAWRSLPGAGVPNTGSVRFSPAPGGRGTEVLVELRYDPPGGKVGAMIAKLFGEEPGQQVDADLRRFKQVMETGEVVHSDASIHGGMHPAQPPEIALRPDLVSSRGGMES